MNLKMYFNKLDVCFKSQRTTIFENSEKQLSNFEQKLTQNIIPMI